MNDLVTPAIDASATFYGALFGWTTEEIPDAGGYRVILDGPVSVPAGRSAAFADAQGRCSAP